MRMQIALCCLLSIELVRNGLVGGGCDNAMANEIIRVNMVNVSGKFSAVDAF